MKLLVFAGRRAALVLSNKVQNVQVRDVQADEIWGYVRKKESHKYPWEADEQSIGDAWCFVGIERYSKQVLTFELGNVPASTQRASWRSCTLPPKAPGGSTADGLQSYLDPVDSILRDRVDYAQLIKVYAQGEGKTAERRYSPAEVVETIRKPIIGEPDSARICTSHIERQNGTMLALHFAFYNFRRAHGSLNGQTHAMAAASRIESGNSLSF
jgi:hypothetical protein